MRSENIWGTQTVRSSFLPCIICVFSSASILCCDPTKSVATLVRLRLKAQLLPTDLCFSVLPVCAPLSLVELRVLFGRTMYPMSFFQLRCYGHWMERKKGQAQWVVRYAGGNASETEEGSFFSWLMTYNLSMTAYRVPLYVRPLKVLVCCCLCLFLSLKPVWAITCESPVNLFF